MSNEFDLTDNKGLDKAVKDIKNNKLLYFSMFPTITLYELGKNLLSSSENNINQAAAVESLIEKGRKNGVKKMSINIESNSGFEANLPIEGASIKTSLGSEGKIKLDIEYS